ncbi:MAG: DNA modification methylase [Acidobacteria bacterium OLB17]|nr:MAG: DNA modification methylase [Acidobacteria bacterium OLB17]
MHTPDFTNENIARIAELFPNCVTESRDEKGEVKRAIDFDQLRQELSGSIVEGPQERYQLNWPGKREALLTANAPIAKTLRPCREESVDFDTTKNLFIEGDNLDALKLLQETYLGKVKMIYIDPPYNTGNDILYKNDYSSAQREYEVDAGLRTDDGLRAVTNTESNGRYHSDWLSMMYARIRLARNFLKEDGIFVITIDHYEIYNLGEVCDEVFGYENRLGLVTVYINPKGRNQEKFFSPCTEYMLVYARDIKSAYFREVVIDDEKAEEFIYEDEKGKFRYDGFMRARTSASREAKPSMWYPLYVSEDLKTITTKKTANFHEVYPETPNGQFSWKTTPETFDDRNQNEYFKAELVNGSVFIFNKYYENQIFKNIWTDKKYFPEFNGTQVIKKLFDGKSYFDFPKSIYAVKDIVKIITENDDLVMDFFAGSGTTAHSVMELNSEDGGRRNYVLVQIPAAVDAKSEAGKDGYSEISAVTMERIRRAGKTIKDEAGLNGVNLDIGFRVLKIDSSNMKDVYYSPDEQAQANLLDQVTNIKEDRTAEDLLFQVLLDWGVDLSLPIVRERISTTENTESTEASNKSSVNSVSSVVNKGFEVFFVDENALAACFDDGVSEDLIKELAKRQPLRVVFRDSGFASDDAKINAEQIFNQMSPGTEVRSI